MRPQGNQGGPAADAAFGEKFRLPLGAAAAFPDGLTLALKSFSHKRPYVGGATQATAHMILSSDRGEEAFSLSVSGTEGKPGTERERRFLREYHFALVGWEYDAFVEIVATRLETVAASYGAPVVLRAGGPVALFDDAFKVRVSGVGSGENAEGRGPMPRVALDVLLDDSGGRPLSQNLYANGTVVPDGTWVGEPGFHVSGRVIQLVRLTEDGAELRVKRA